MVNTSFMVFFAVAYGGKLTINNSFHFFSDQNTYHSYLQMILKMKEYIGKSHDKVGLLKNHLCMTEKKHSFTN